ncbi:MAG: binary toxin-like calcium binding domain-containing protein, partial [bacterium]
MMITISTLINRLVQRHRFAFIRISFTGLLAAIPVTSGFSQSANFQSSQPERTISYVKPDGAIRTMLANADADEDGVSNELELDGYYYCRREGVMHAAAQPCDGVLPDITYKTDPDRWSTDGDPYSDFTEVSGVNMHPAVTVPENHPLVAASPVIVVQMPTYTIIPNGEITDTDGGSRSDAMTQEASVGVEVGYSETVGAEVGTGGMNASASATLSMSLSASFTLGSTVTNEVNWSRARSVNPSEAAFLSLGIFFENRGSAPILDLQTQFNLVLGGKVIATITPDLTVNTLAPGERFPEASAPNVVVERDVNNNQIALTLEELKLVQLGAPLALVVTQVDGKIGRWNSDTQSFDNDVDWSSWKANIEPVVVNLHADLGDGETHLYKIYAGTAVYDPGLTFRDVISLVFDVQENSGPVTIEGRPYPGNWFLTSPSQAVQDEWNAQGRPENLLDLPMHRETIVSMKSPGSQPGARINLATFTPDFRHVLVNASPRAFPILSVRAEVKIDGQSQSVTLVKDGAFYKNAEPFTAPAGVNGTVFVENAKGDISETNTVLPAFYSNAEDVIDYSSFLPVPGGDEYLLFMGGDTTKPAIIYCDFSFDNGGPEVIGREYLTLSTSDSTNFSEHPERFFFKKIRLDVNSLVVDPFDITFSNATGTGHGFGYSTQSCSPRSGNIDLQGTAFHLDPSAQFEATGEVHVNSVRKQIDFGGGVPNACTVAGVRGQLKLAYDDFVELTLHQSLTTGQSLLFTGIDGAAPPGYVNMGAQTSL